MSKLKKRIAAALVVAALASVAALADVPAAAPVEAVPLEYELDLSAEAPEALIGTEPEASPEATPEVSPQPTGEPQGTLRVEPTQVTLGVGEKRQMSWLVEGATAEGVTYATSDKAVATVSAGGVIKARGVGEATVTVTSSNGLTATCAVAVLPAPQSLTLNESSVTLAYDVAGNVGLGLQLEATLPDGTASLISYKSTKPSVVSVTADGRITACGVGKARVRAMTFNKKKAYVTVKVLAAPQSFELNTDALTLAPKGKHVLMPVLPPKTTGTFTFKSDNTKVAKVNASTGKVVAVAPGEATVTATCFNGTYATCVVTVLPKAERVVLDAEEMALGVGERYTLTAHPQTADGQSAWGKMRYKSSNARVVKVDATGAMKAVKAGEATVTVTVNGAKAECRVTVVKAPDAVSVAAQAPKLRVGETTALDVTLTEGSASHVTYSYDSAVVEVSESGAVVAVGPGRTAITAATHNGRKATCTVHVLAEDEDRAMNVAHRGGCGYWPENTLEAFRNTASTGAKAVELDARTTKDGIQVVHHDAYFMQGGLKRYINLLSYAQLKSLKPSLCTLEEAIEVIRETDLEMHLELKDTATAKACVALVNTHGMSDRTVYISFVYDQLLRVRQLAPDARIGFIINDTPSYLATALKTLKASFIFQKADYLTRANIVKWQNAGYGVGVWTVNEADQIARWLDEGVDFLTSNYPKLTTEAM